MDGRGNEAEARLVKQTKLRTPERQQIVDDLLPKPA
jgi:hypothetical protein